MSRPRHRPPPRSSRTWRAWRYGLLLVCLIAGFRLLRSIPPARSLPDVSHRVEVARVIDGDTLLLATGDRVRLLGIDTPETKHPDRPPEPWGPEASAFTQAAVGGRVVQLEYDRERVDDYGRILAWVWADERLVNLEIVRAGFSRAVTGFPIRTDRKRLLEQAQADAQRARRGMWSSFGAEPPMRTSGSSADGPGTRDIPAVSSGLPH